MHFRFLIVDCVLRNKLFKLALSCHNSHAMIRYQKREKNLIEIFLNKFLRKARRMFSGVLAMPVIRRRALPTIPRLVGPFASP